MSRIILFKYREVLLCYPVILYCKSKIFYPYVIYLLVSKVDRYNNLFSNRNLLNSFSLYNIYIEPSDQKFLDERISLISEEENLIIYNQINIFEDKINNCKSPLNLVFNEFIKKYDESIYKDFLFPTFSTILNKFSYSKIFYVGKDKSKINFFDFDYKNYVDLKILEFFAFFIHYNKNKSGFINFDDENEIEDNIRVDNKLENNLINLSYTSNQSSFKKSLLKPFNKQEILHQLDCETDYGDKKVTKKDIKIREDNIKKVISNANKEFFEKIEDEIIHGQYKQKQSNIVFCIPNDRNSIINKFN